MHVDEAVQLLELMGIPSLDIIIDDRGWARCQCPLASGLHRNGVDEHPSFGIHVKDGNYSTYKCFTCGRGTVSDLVHKYNFTAKNPNSDVSSFYLESQYRKEEAAVLEFKDKYSREPAKQVIRPVPEHILSTHIPLKGVIGGQALRVKEWLMSRGIDPRVAYLYDVRMDNLGNIAFPMTDTDGVIYAIHLRSITNKFFWHVKDENENISFYKPDVWFGLPQWNPTQPTIVVESQTDLLRLKTLNPELNVIASCGPLGPIKVARLNLCSEVWLGYDADDAGRKYTINTVKWIKSDMCKFWRLNWRPGKDAGNLVDSVQLAQIIRNKREVIKENDIIMLKPETTIPRQMEYKDKY